MHPVEKGDLSVAMLTACFLRNHYTVLKPISELQRYDLVIDRGAGFERIQCKTGRLRGGAILFNTASIHGHRGKPRKSYRGEIEAFGVYCHELGKCFLVPVDIVGTTGGSLRIKTPTNRQHKKVHLASQFEI